MTHRSPRGAILMAAVAAALAIGVSLFLGAASIPPARVLDALLGRGAEMDTVVIRDLRLARALLAAVCGAALAGAGVVFQGLFRNPLADPYVLGISGGAGLGAVIALVIGASSLVFTSSAAFAGGLAAGLLTWTLGRSGGRTPVTSLLLAGFAVGSFSSALLSVLLLISTHNWDEVLRWLFGSVAHPDAWRRLAFASPLVALGLGAVAFRARELNVLLTGDESARHLGVEVERSRLWLLAAGSVLTATAVACCGIVGFVGLVVPHAVRLVAGPDHRSLLPASALAGAAVLASADLLARTVISPHELPVGALTALLGAPFFLGLLRRRMA